MTESSFKPGTFVTCTVFKGVGEIVSGPNRKGQYSVRLGHLSLWVAGDSLVVAEPEKPKKPSEASRVLREGIQSGKDASIRLDLHGHKVADALEVLERTIDKAILQNTSRIEIIHGFGTGAVKQAVDGYLVGCKHISRFSVDEKNRGTTWAYLD